MADRNQYIQGLRVLANILEENEEVNLPSDGDSLPMILWPSGAWTDRERESLAELVRTVRTYTDSEVRKSASNAYLCLTTTLGGPDGLVMQISANRERVCERVVTGVETVTKRVPDPEQVAKIPEVEIEEEVEIVEWQCGSILRDSEETSDADAA